MSCFVVHIITFKTEQLLEIVAFFLVEKVTDCDHRTLIVANVAFFEKLRFLLKLSKDTDRNKSPNRNERHNNPQHNQQDQEESRSLRILPREHLINLLNQVEVPANLIVNRAYNPPNLFNFLPATTLICSLLHLSLIEA